MTLKDIKKKVLQLIEEIDDTKTTLTNDPDIEKKLNSVINQVQFELARMKKIPVRKSIEVKAGEVFDLNTLEKFYQLRHIFSHSAYELVENMVIFEEDETVTFFYYKYPETITDETTDDYEFELTQDALEIMPYGVAGDILKSDVSTGYGEIYSQRYETMLQRLDPRYSMGSITLEGGVDI